MSSATPRTGRRPSPGAVGLLLLALLVLVSVVRCAWVCDDAFITLRSVDNLVHGYGPTWNVAERVQAFTHPLWMLVLAPVYALTREPYYTLLALSFLATAGTLWLLVRGVAASAAGAGLALAVLVSSKAFVDYSTSGLENPLTHLLLAAFLALHFRESDRPVPAWAPALVAALAALNRLDTLLLFLPALIGAAWRRPWRHSARSLLLGFTPLIAWTLFSLVYYGFPFPNTAYAKLGTGIPELQLVVQGVHYLLSSLRMDPLTLAALFAATLWAGLREDPRGRPVALGLVLYLLYVTWIGGDFMSGRFLAAPLLAGAALLARWRPRPAGARLLVPIVAVLAVGLVLPRAPLRSGAGYGAWREGGVDGAGVADERAFYFDDTGLLKARRGGAMPSHPSAFDGKAARLAGPAVVVRGGVGFFGYYAGPEVHIVEPWAITDPLLARLPVSRQVRWRIGHFTRDVPEGYLESLESGDNVLRDPDVAALFDAVATVTRGPVWSRERWLEIWRLNRGAYRVGR
jgi:arabinofuranosyltransferase